MRVCVLDCILRREASTVVCLRLESIMRQRLHATEQWIRVCMHWTGVCDWCDDRYSGTSRRVYVHVAATKSCLARIRYSYSAATAAAASSQGYIVDMGLLPTTIEPLLLYGADTAIRSRRRQPSQQPHPTATKPH